MKRRSFLYSGSLAVGAISAYGNSADVFTDTAQTANQAALYLSDSGVYGRDPAYVIGMLVTENVQSHESALLHLRDQYGYRTRLTYHKNDRYKLDYAKAAIDYFMDASGLSFTGKVPGLPAGTSVHRLSFSQLSYRRVELLNELLAATNHTATQVSAKGQSVHGPSEMYQQHFQQASALTYASIPTRTNNLLQLSGFIAGCVAGSLRNTVRNPIKIELIDYLKSKLGVAAFSPTSIETTKFTLIVT